MLLTREVFILVIALLRLPAFEAYNVGCKCQRPTAYVRPTGMHEADRVAWRSTQLRLTMYLRPELFEEWLRLKRSNKPAVITWDTYSVPTL
jgi:hypothetical protein